MTPSLRFTGKIIVVIDRDLRSPLSRGSSRRPRKKALPGLFDLTPAAQQRALAQPLQSPARPFRRGNLITCADAGLGMLAAEATGAASPRTDVSRPSWTSCSMFIAARSRSSLRRLRARRAPNVSNPGIESPPLSCRLIQL
ncbi:hypothetical protein [Bosea sp. (in: a-proteobacteria)]|uniref:hypothetical protein n=1 Tax=Bosea sp. (in: a-proteobacteria) TaxID=1871050 RepID=UPI0025C69406|nr:hypothetical protein [Bosea sp. (in: a-proteobacteria)]MBR3191372.1 hypothetical protein [Bosea sp. (in: a-proteobacteria)]